MFVLLIVISAMPNSYLSKNVGVNLGANLVQHSVKTYQFYKTIYDYTLTISHDMNVIRDIKHFQTVA